MSGPSSISRPVSGANRMHAEHLENMRVIFGQEAEE